MSRNALPMDREDEFYGYENSVFSLWFIEVSAHDTRFYYNGYPMFNIQRVLSESEMVEHMNLHEYIYHNGFKKGTRQTQERIKSALGIVED